MKRVCHFSSAHRGLDVRIYIKECVSLAAAGYEVHLVINASPEDVATAARQGVTLHAVVPKSSGRLSRMLLHAWRCYRAARKVDAGIYHFHDPELMPYGIRLSLAGKRVIYDVHEDLPKDIEIKAWIPRWARQVVAWLFGGLEHLGARYFFSIVTATPYIESRFRRFNPGALAINNYPLPDELAPSVSRQRRQRQICYVGGISRVRGIRPLVESLPLIPGVRLALCGRFADAEFETELRVLPGWAQVDYYGQVSRSEVQPVMTKSFAGILPFLPAENHINAQPNKMFEYMSAELPVIASDFPLWRDIIETAGCGLCVDPTDVQAIAAAVQQLAENPVLVEQLGKAGRAAVLMKYNWPAEAKKLIEFYEERS